MTSLRIALLHYSCPPVVGGVEEIVRQQASLFYRYGHNVKIFAGAGEQFSDDYSVEIDPLLSSRNSDILDAHKLAEGGDLRRVEDLTRRIQQYLTEALQGFDVLIAHNTLTMGYNLPLTIALSRLAGENGIPVISWNHDSPYFYKEYPSYLNAAPWNILRQYNPEISYVMISESRKEQFYRLYETADKIHVVPNGIDPIRFFRLDQTTVKLIQEENFLAGGFLMMQPSRLHPRKNMELSIRVCRALQNRDIHARLLITGAYVHHEPEFVNYYEKLVALSQELKVEKDVLIMAEYAFEDGERLIPDRIIIRDLYLLADILFLPSWQEGFGIPLLESGMIKLPVVCSDIPPFREIGGDHVCFFDLNDTPEQIADKILDFLSIQKSHQFFKHVLRNYAWDNIYHYMLLPILQRVIEEHRASPA